MLVITEEMKSLKVAYGTYLNTLEKLLTDSGTVEDVSAVIGYQNKRQSRTSKCQV